MRPASSGVFRPLGLIGVARAPITKPQAPNLKQTRNTKTRISKLGPAVLPHHCGSRPWLPRLGFGVCLFGFVWVLVLDPWCFGARGRPTVLETRHSEPTAPKQPRTRTRTRRPPTRSERPLFRCVRAACGFAKRWSAGRSGNVQVAAFREAASGAKAQAMRVAFPPEPRPPVANGQVSVYPPVGSP